MIVRVPLFVCVCVCVSQCASNVAVELWLSALSPGWQLLAALLSQFSHNHPV